jgi:hypothetical protein
VVTAADERLARPGATKVGTGREGMPSWSMVAGQSGSAACRGARSGAPARLPRGDFASRPTTTERGSSEPGAQTGGRAGPEQRRVVPIALMGRALVETVHGAALFPVAPTSAACSTKEPDGTPVLGPATVVTGLERRFLANAAPQAQIAYATADPEQRVPRKRS